ncbi:MAG: hypothetical protein IPP83_10205 [Flavobacteriales bacterium]|nr:hypothetical protein [Flavobacteriales bacterium]
MKLALSVAFAIVVALQTASAQVVVDPPERTIRTTKAEVVSMVISPKGDRILVGLDKGAELYDLETGKKIHSYPYNEDGGTAVYHVAFNENGEYVLLIGHSGKRVVWGVKGDRPEPSLQQHRWVPDPRAVKAMGLDMSNSTFDRFYQQQQLKIGDHTVQSGKNGMVEVLDPKGESIQKLDPGANKDQHHRAPLLRWEEWLLTGTDDGRVLFYRVR